MSTTTSATGYLIGKSEASAGWAGTFYVASNVYFSNSNLYASSDERLKDIKDDFKVNLDELSNIRKVYYTYKDDTDEKLQIGTIAQDVQKYHPEIVDTIDGEMLSVSYERLSILALAAIDELYKKVKKLEEKIK